jgi:hypothetical protein
MEFAKCAHSELLDMSDVSVLENQALRRAASALFKAEA